MWLLYDYNPWTRAPYNVEQYGNVLRSTISNCKKSDYLGPVQQCQHEEDRRYYQFIGKTPLFAQCGYQMNRALHFTPADSGLPRPSLRHCGLDSIKQRRASVWLCQFVCLYDSFMAFHHDKAAHLQGSSRANQFGLKHKKHRHARAKPNWNNAKDGTKTPKYQLSRWIQKSFHHNRGDSTENDNIKYINSQQ